MNDNEKTISVSGEERLAEKHLNSFLEIPLPVLLVKRDKFSRYVLYSYNSYAQEIFAVPLERLINKEVRIFWPKETWDVFRKGIIAAIRKDKNSVLDSILIEKEGNTKSFSLRIWKVANSIACCIFLETIDKKIFTQSVLNERLKYEELFKNTPVMMLNIDLNGKIIDVNLNWIQKTGFLREELIGKNIQDYFDKESNPILLNKKFSDLLILNELKNAHIQIKTKSGENISAIINARALFDINGKFIRCYLVAQDVSELKAIQEEYENTEKLLRSLFENSTSAILLYSPEKGIVESNLNVEKYFDIKINTILGKKIFELEFLKNSIENFNDFLQNFDSNPNLQSQFDLEYHQKNIKKYLEVSLKKIYLKNEPHLLITISDRSTEKIKDKKIHESEVRFQALFEASINALKLIDFDGKIFQMNRKARELFEELIDNKGQIKLKFKNFDYQKWISDFIKSDKTEDLCEYKFKSKTGIKIIEEKLLKITFDSGDRLIFSISRDVTKERLAELELRKSEQNLRDLNDTKNRLIYILSHDLRAPTSSIIGLVNAILEEPAIDQKEVSSYLHLIKSAASYQLDLINNLLDWSLLESGKFNFSLEPKNLEYAVYNSLNSVRGLLEQKKIKLIVNIHSKLVLIDLNLFSRILINLVSNAIKFSYPESKVWIQSKLLNNGRVELSIKDYGIGFDKEILEKLFTFKEKVSRHGTSGERGTGLGLSICKDIVKILGGDLKIKSPIIKKNKNSIGSIVSFDLKIVEPKILFSYRLNKILAKKLLEKKLNGYKIIFKDPNSYFKNDFDDYFVFIVLDSVDLNNHLLDKFINKYKTARNLIVVTKDKENISNGLKLTDPENLVEFLQNEIDRIEFEWKQQANLAKEMKKMWL